MQEKIIWTPKKVKVSDLKPWKKNPRKISNENFERLKGKIRERGNHGVIVVDVDLTTLSGSQRTRAFKELGITEVTALIPHRKLTEDEREKIALESNINDGEWDLDALFKSFEPITLTGIGLDLDELKEKWSELLEVEDDDFDEKREIEKAKETKIKPGNMFSLGKHQLVCGDALDLYMIKRFMGPTEIDFVDIDLPFNIGLSYNYGVGKKKGGYGGSTNDSKSDEEYKEFVKKIMKNAISVSKTNCHYIFWCDERYVWLFQTLCKELGIDSKRLLIWLKNNSSPTHGIAFNKAAEFAIYGTTGHVFLNKNVSNLTEIANKEFGVGNESFDRIQDFLSVWTVKRLPTKHYNHPTQKSPSLHEKALRRCTRPGDSVLDLTAGSGSLMVACEQLGRVAYLCEKEPIFCQVIINRFEKLTGIRAKLIN